VEIWETVHQTLQEIGKEALAQGSRPYGLRAYGSYYREKFPGSFGKNCWEEPISEGLAQGLYHKSINGTTMNACPERLYPFGGNCDVVISLNGIHVVWIECKAAYTDDINGDYEAQDPSCWSDGWWKQTVEGRNGRGGIRKDVDKLRRLADLRPPVTRYVGVLLLGFDRRDKPIAAEELYPLLPAELVEKPWIPGHRLYEKKEREGIMQEDGCKSRRERGFRERLWFWYRPVGGSGGP
jgi:hypothetical protein